MSICTTTDLGDFDYCDGVTIDFVDSEVLIKCVETKYICTREDGTFGKLNPGHYTFEFEETNYIFEVV